MNYKDQQSGFTLVEILVVVAIIGLIASITMTALNRARISARDSKRISDMQQIQKALALYLLNNNSYPAAEWENGCGGWDTASVDENSNGLFFIEGLEQTGIISKMPKDPIGTGTCNGQYTYFYHVYGGTSYATCPRRFYVLGIGNLEGTTGVHPSSPGWSCPGLRDWHNEFEWVTGGYEQ